MKILFVIDSLGSGGAQNQMTILASELKAREHQVSVFTYFHQDFFKARLTDKNITVNYIEKKGKIGFEVINGLHKILKKESFDVIVSFMDTPNLYSVLSTFRLKRKPILIISYRTMTDFKQMSFASRKVKEFINKRADFIVSNSNHERLRWTAKYPSLKRKWLTIYNGVSKSEETKISNQKRSGNLLCVGSVSKFKNGICLIEALKILKDSFDLNLTVNWIGRKQSGISGSETYALKMEKLIEEYNLEESWNWVGQKKNLDSHYKTSDALIHASIVEGLPNVVCEAQTFGCPVLISNILDHPLMIQENVNGYLFDPNAPLELAQKIKKFYELSDNEYLQMKRASKDIALEKYSIEKFANEFESIFN